ncbi:hypothetical protein, partial [Klebsiella pneumoniae]|uniref:hypothetical protein n=1 Tax=Klebsiella pneumoniae TaxID=573 RepID=UPI003855072F
MGKRAALVIANSRNGADYWKRLRPLDSVRVLPNALPVTEIAAAGLADVGRLNISPTAEVILFAGRFSPEKNLS